MDLRIILVVLLGIPLGLALIYCGMHALKLWTKEPYTFKQWRQDIQRTWSWCTWRSMRWLRLQRRRLSPSQRHIQAVKYLQEHEGNYAYRQRHPRPTQPVRRTISLVS